MNTPELERLTRLAQSLPVDDVKMERIDSAHGEIYFAYGNGPDGLHGIWGHRDMARILEFKDTATVEGVRQVLVDDAAAFIGDLVERGVYG